MDRLTTYENMDVLAGSVDLATRGMLVSYWRRRAWGLSVTQANRRRVRLAIPELWRTLFNVTTPDQYMITRWSRANGYVAR